MTKRVTYIEIDVDRCSLTYGVAPCTASLVTSPATGTRKCFNSLGTCQDAAHFTDGGVTLRFGVPTKFLPGDIECIPALESVSISPATLNPGVDIGKRASVRVTLNDHYDADTGPHGDPYLSTRSYNPFTQGTFFGKFRARHPYLRGRALRVIRGEVGDDIADMETRHFIIDTFDGPLADGSFQITAKDPIKFADTDRSQAPLPSEGYTNAAVASGDTTLTLLPTGIGADYQAAGYAALGGKEIVYYEHDPYAGLTANTQLLLKFNGADGSTTITDSSGNSRSGTCVGNAQLDTAFYKYGSASLLLDGTGDYVTVADNNAWTFSGDFTIDFWFRPASVSVRQHIFSHSNGSGTGYYQFVLNASNQFELALINSSTQIFAITSATGMLEVSTWYHIAVVRSGSVWTVYLDGVAVMTTTNATAISNYTGTFNIGCGPNAGVECANGWIDEFRIQSAAQWTADFSALLPGPYASSKDAFTITRAQYNTTAVAHSTQARFQWCLAFTGQRPSDIIYTLLVTYSGVDASLIPLSEWNTEDDAYYGVLLTALIPDPFSVVKLINEVIEQAGIALWWDELNQLIRFKVLKPVSDSADAWDEALLDNISVKDQPDKRISQVWTYFAQINPLRPVDEVDNYRSLAVETDLESEANYGSPAIKKIKSRWIATGGRSTATRLNQLILARYKDPPRKLTFDVFRDGVNVPALGGYANVSAWFLQDDTGAAAAVPIQIIRVNPDLAKYSVEAEEFAFDNSIVDAISNIRTVTIDANVNNVDFRALFDALYPAPQSGNTVKCVIASGVVVGSTSTSTYAFTVGSWPAGVTVEVENNGWIIGKGGAGGRGYSNSDGAAYGGSAGGPAFYTRRAINLSGSGIIGGGGGGGGGGGANNNQNGGGGGGAGRGQTPSTGGGGGSGSITNGSAGGNSTDAAAGAGGSAAVCSGGAGGNLGAAGSAGTNGSGVSGGSGGAAGNAIDGNSYITESSTITFYGSRVN